MVVITLIGRTTKIAGKQYKQVLLYLPTDLVGDSAFPLSVGSPCEITIDMKQKQLVVKPISESEAVAKGWSRRKRGKG
jgi:hypothetical protein